MDNKTVFISGSNRGLGKEFVETFAKNGYNIYAHSRVETESFVTFVENIKDRYQIQITPVYFDMLDINKMKEEVKKIVLSKQPIHVLINNAGVAHTGLFGMTPVNTIKDIFNVNLFSHMELTQLILKGMIRQKIEASIINIGSITGMFMSEGQTAYACSKAALHMWTKILAAEYGKYQIRVNAVAPALIDTDMKDNLNAEELAYYQNRTVLGRNATVKDVANLVSFLASSKSSFITGQIIRVDGGLL